MSNATCQYCGDTLANARATTCKAVECQRARNRRYGRARKLRVKLATLDLARRCEGCSKTLPISMRADARHCSRECIDRRRAVHAERRDWHIATKERRLALQREWRRKNPAAVRGYKLKRRAVETYAVSEREWIRLVDRHRGRCAYCGQVGAITVEHVIPVSRGGRHSIGNLLPVCQFCNGSKGDKLLMEWKAFLARGGRSIALARTG